MWVARYLTACEVDLLNFLRAHFLSFLVFFPFFTLPPFVLLDNAPFILNRMVCQSPASLLGL